MDGKDKQDGGLLFEKVIVGQHTIIGENHRRETDLDYTHSDEVFQELLTENQDSIFILESDTQKSVAWLEEELKGSFMSQAGEYAIKYDLPYVVMDDGRMAGYDVWQFAGTNINPQEFAFVRALSKCSVDFRKGLSPKDTLESLGVTNENEDPFRNSRIQAVKLYSLLTNGYFSQESINDLIELIKMDINYDAVCREIVYQAKVQRITEMYPNKKLFMVFGGNHVPGIQKTLEDETHRYRTPLLPSNEIKRRISVYRQFLASYR